MPFKQKNDLTSRYHRQLMLPNFDLKAQQALLSAKVLIIGCGGLGVPVIQYLAGAGVGHFTLYDPDLIELSNLHRQTIYRHCDLGRSKATRAAEFIYELDPTIKVEAKGDWISIHNVQKIVADHDITIDCTDGLPNKFLINDACVLEKRSLIHGAAMMMEGRLLTITPQSACLRCFFTTIPTAPFTSSCLEMGILGPVCGIIGSIMAAQAIKILTKIGTVSENNYLISTFLHDPTITAYKIEKNPQCYACGKNPIQFLSENKYIQASC